MRMGLCQSTKANGNATRSMEQASQYSLTAVLSRVSLIGISWRARVSSHGHKDMNTEVTCVTVRWKDKENSLMPVGKSWLETSSAISSSKTSSSLILLTTKNSSRRSSIDLMVSGERKLLKLLSANRSWKLPNSMRCQMPTLSNTRSRTLQMRHLIWSWRVKEWMILKELKVTCRWMINSNE